MDKEQEMPKRTLQFIKGKSQKFWEIRLSGKSHSVTYGKLGAAGRTVTKSFETAKDAKESYNNLVSEKLKKGYADESNPKSNKTKSKKATKKKKTTARIAAAKKKRMTTEVVMPQSIEDCWRVISRWLRENHPGKEFKVPDGAKATEIAKVEKALCRILPEDFKKSSRVQCSTSIPSPSKSAFWGYDYAYTLMKPDDCLGTWKMMTEMYDIGEFADSDGRVKAGKGVVKQWWSPGWFPFAGNGGGDYYCVDLGPTYPGTVGQVILFSHDSPSRPVFAKSFSEFMQQLAAAVANGHYTWCPDKEALQRKRKTAFPCF